MTEQIADNKFMILFDTTELVVQELDTSRLVAAVVETMRTKAARS